MRPRPAHPHPEATRALNEGRMHPSPWPASPQLWRRRPATRPAPPPRVRSPHPPLAVSLGHCVHSRVLLTRKAPLFPPRGAQAVGVSNRWHRTASGPGRGRFRLQHIDLPAHAARAGGEVKCVSPVPSFAPLLGTLTAALSGRSSAPRGSAARPFWQNRITDSCFIQPGRGGLLIELQAAHPSISADADSPAVWRPCLRWRAGIGPGVPGTGPAAHFPGSR